MGWDGILLRSLVQLEHLAVLTNATMEPRIRRLGNFIKFKYNGSGQVDGKVGHNGYKIERFRGWGNPPF